MTIRVTTAIVLLLLTMLCGKTDSQEPMEKPTTPFPTGASGPFGEGYKSVEFEGLGSLLYHRPTPRSNPPVTIWTDADKPQTVDSGDANPLEVGFKFKSDVSGVVTGLRFYKAATNTGKHVGHLWSINGTLLAGIDFTCETASGWQTATLSSPVTISANTVYLASYFAPNGHYSYSRPYFTSSHDTPPLHALQDGASGPNGTYNYPGSGFPTATYQQANYWADVVFVPDDKPVPPAPLALLTVEPPSGPTSGGTNVALGGSGFAAGAVVKFGSTQSPTVNVLSSTQIVAVSPSNSTGSKDMTVANPGGDAVTMPAGYIYVETISGGGGGGGSTTPTGQGLLSGMTPAKFTVPAGWTLAQTVDFESGAGNGSRLISMSIDCSGKGHGSNCAAKGNYGPTDTISWLSQNLQGTRDLYLSFWEYAEPNGRLNVDYDIGGMIAPQQTDAVIRFQVGCGGHDGGNQVADIPYWWNALTERPILYVEGVYGTPWPNFATWGWGANCLSPNMLSSGAQGYGNWTQWEIHVKNNTPTSGSGPADGEVQMYQAGILTNQIRPYSGQCSGQAVACSNMNGTLNVANVAHYAQVGGVYTAIHAFLDQAKTKCSPVPAPSNATMYDTFVRNFSNPAPCANQAPSNGYIPTFNRYFDDIIVLKR